MIKRFLIVLVFVLCFISNANSAKAGPVSDVDQACLSGSGEYGRIWLNQYSDVTQLFAPTKNTLHMVTLGLGTTYPSAKARVKVIDFTGGDVSIIAQKYITVTEDKYYRIDFGSVPLTGDYYGIKVEMANQNEPFYWNAITSENGECHPGGFAMIIGATSYFKVDMIFAIRTYDTTVEEDENNDPLPQDPTDQSSSSSDPISSADPVPAETSTQDQMSPASSASNPDPSPLADSPSSANSSTTTSTSPTPTTNEILEPSTTKPANDPSVAGDATSANKTNANSDKLISDKELQESIALLLSDIEKQKYKDGAFGLSGVVGRILTWPVFYGICGLIFLLILLVIIRLIKKNKANVKANKGNSSTVIDANTVHNSVRQNIPAESENNSDKKSLSPEPKKKKNIVLIIIILIIMIILIEKGYRIYLSTVAEDDVAKIDNKEVAAVSDPVISENSAPATEVTTVNQPTKTVVNSETTSTSATIPTENPAPVPTPEESDKEKTIDYFIEIALAYQGVERWTSDFNVGYAPGALDSDLETCLDGFIRDFNNASPSAKLHKNREEADIKIYVVSPEEMVQYGGEDAGRGFAFLYKNSNNEDYKGEIFINNQLPDNQEAKCYLAKHEMMHAVGFRGHSDLFWEGIMAVPTVSRNTENLMSDVDTKVIQMLYDTGLPLKSNETETRAYLGANYPE